MNNIRKPFTPIDEQIIILKNRGLTFENEKDAQSKLLHNNYYTIINGYKYPFLANEKDEEEHYKTGASFDELYALYKFDCDLRSLLLKYILKIEHQLKSVISHHFAQKHSDEKYPDYLKLDNFDVSIKKETFQKLLDDIAKELNHQRKNNNPMLEHYEKEYNNIPPWILVSIFSFGMIRSFYCCMPNKDQNEIARHFGLKPDVLTSYLSALNYYRNACAHDERIYNRRVKNKVVRKDKYGNKFEYNKVYVLVLIIKDMLDSASFMTFYSQLDEYINELEQNLKTISVDSVLRAMGMPEDKAIRKAELGPLEKGHVLSNEEFGDILKRYIMPMLPVSSELQVVPEDDENKGNRLNRIVEQKDGILYLAESRDSMFVYRIIVKDLVAAQLLCVEMIESHLATFIDYIHIFWNLSSLSAQERDKIAIAFPVLCEQAYALTICHLICTQKSLLVRAEYNAMHNEFKRIIGTVPEKERGGLVETLKAKKGAIDQVVKQENIAEKTLYEILMQFDSWATKTYEGQKKTFGIILCKEQLLWDEDNFDYIAFLKSDYSATINDGVYSAVELYADGAFKQHLTINNTFNHELPFVAYPFCGFADLCTEDKIGILLTETGDILIINDKKLCYTKHNGRWVQSMADRVIEQIQKELNLDNPNKAITIYQAIVDVSYSRGGACMGIIDTDELSSELHSMIQAGLLSDIEMDKKRCALKGLISSTDKCGMHQKSFFELSRALRRELLELDGAMVLSTSGRIHVIGTIIKLDGSGSDGGGRTAAATQLSKYGLAIKVSQDGYVQLFKNKEKILEIMT